MATIEICHDYEDSSRIGPKKESTARAQRIVDEFIDTGEKACRVFWSELSPDFDEAKRQLTARISWSNFYREASDLGIRTNRENQEIYLVRKGML